MCILFQRSTSDLAAIRERILFLLGSLGGVVNVALLERESAGTMFNQAVSWDTCRKLEFAVPFSDLKPSIFMGTYSSCMYTGMHVHVHVCLHV